MSGYQFSKQLFGVALAPCLLIGALGLPGCSRTPEEPAGIAAEQPSSIEIEQTEPLVPDAEDDCCRCEIAGTQALADSDILPCTFDHPAGWQGQIGDDGALVSAVVGANCSTVCAQGAPGIAFSVGTRPDSNAETMEQIWREAMPIVGDARCQDSTVTFFSPPGADPNGLIGGVKFYIGYGGKKYSGGATFTCGVPGGWLELRALFINSFRTNPGTTFGE
jgi:hypothetical protein